MELSRNAQRFAQSEREGASSGFLINFTGIDLQKSEPKRHRDKEPEMSEK